MSDNLSKDSCEREINAYLDLPAEVFTDIFKLLPHHTLVQRIQPVNLAFKAICDRNVKTVHVITRAEEFFRKLKAGDPEANQQLEDLSGHNCALAGQFMFGGNSLTIYTNNGESQAIQSVLRHSLDLFQQCQIQTESKPLVSTEQLAYLTVLEPSKPVFVYIHIEATGPAGSSEASLSTLLRHPTILNCSRLELFEQVRAQDDCQPIFDWLHHNPMNMDLESSSSCINVVDQQMQPEIRCLMLSCFDYDHKQNIEWVLERCVQNLQQSQNPSDRRHFLFAFYCFDHLNELNRFARTENPSTGEVLLLERFVDEGGFPYYRLLRCLASQIANGTEELYAKLFKSPDQFNIGDGEKKPLMVVIEEKQHEIEG